MALDLVRLDQLLAAAEGVRVVVLGDLMLDIYLTGSVERISPEAPVPVVHVGEERSALGGAANVAANVVRLGARCDVIGVIGADAAGREIRQGFSALDGGAARPRLVEAPGRPTTTKTRVMARRQQVVRFDRESVIDLGPAEVAELQRELRAAIVDADVLVLEDYNKGVLTPELIGSALELAAANGVPTVVDPKVRHVFAYAGATVFKPNAVELAQALGPPIRPDDDVWLEEARRRFGCENLVVTLGERGMIVCSGGARPLRIPAVAREVFDVSGAGDTVTACLAVALGGGAALGEAAVFANFAAAIEVGKPGVATVSPAELRESISRFHAVAVH